MSAVEIWLAALEQRHLANLTRPELTRALRALSSCYVERRDKLTSGAALDGAGKRAAFALFYGPLHFFTVTAVVHAMLAHEMPIDTIVDLGCGTGVGGAAWANASVKPPAIVGVDRNGWAVDEANWTYRTLGLNGQARTGDLGRGDVLARLPIQRLAGSAMLLAYTVNELPADTRAALLERVSQGLRAGARLLLVEPIARGVTTWWPEWTARLSAEGARADEWRFPAALPPLTRQIAKGAGLDPREFTARSIAKL
ncbi:MAG: class I SAM-dependent methyltransferase [Vicinamibacterales bacterium]